MKWYFCWCHETDFRKDHAWPDLIRVAVESAIQNTNLEPHFIYDGPENDFTRELADKGVNIHFHRLSFEDKIKSHSNSLRYQSIARGAFLRFDIPLIDDGSEEFVLYTDADVIFQKGGDKFNGYCPEFIAAAPQFDRGSIRDLNSGIMILNIKKWKEKHKDLVSFTERNLNLGLDQEILREFVRDDYLLLPDRFNWKPYWGVNPDAAIIHWHGPKPETAGVWLKNKNIDINPTWESLLSRGEAYYGKYVRMHDDYLQTYILKSLFIDGKSSSLTNYSPIHMKMIKNTDQISLLVRNDEFPSSQISINVIPSNGNSFIVNSFKNARSEETGFYEIIIESIKINKDNFLIIKDMAGRLLKLINKSETSEYIELKR